MFWSDSFSCAGLQVLVTTRVTEPLAGHPSWANRRPVAVIVSQPGHYVSYLRQANIWFRLDSASRTVIPQNPFQAQMPNNMICVVAFTR